MACHLILNTQVNSFARWASHHMERVETKCQGGVCNAIAARHVVFGLRFFEAPADIHVSEIPYTSEHLDLCSRHVGEVRRQYVHVVEYDLNGCPSDRCSRIKRSTTGPT